MQERTGSDSGQRFCVVTPNYNMGRYLEQTLCSVLDNLRPGDEYYVIDGGSTDGSVDIIRRYERKLTGWVSEPDDGYADALRKGFAMSSAPLMCWINSGDLLLQGSLELRRDAFARSDADMLYADDFYIDEQGIILQQSNGHMHNLRAMMAYTGWTPLQDACSWRRSLYDAVGGIDGSLRHAADYDLFLRMSRHGRCRYMPAVLSAFRRHEAQKSVAEASLYEVEREQCRSRQAPTSAWSLRFALTGLLWLRSRLPAMHRRSSAVVGRAVSEVPASYRGGRG